MHCFFFLQKNFPSSKTEHDKASMVSRTPMRNLGEIRKVAFWLEAYYSVLKICHIIVATSAKDFVLIRCVGFLHVPSLH